MKKAIKLPDANAIPSSDLLSGAELILTQRSRSRLRYATARQVASTLG
jgi:hypothetical protein